MSVESLEKTVSMESVVSTSSQCLKSVTDALCQPSKQTKIRSLASEGGVLKGVALKFIIKLISLQHSILICRLLCLVTAL